jgi:hypothetical protein
MIHMAGAPTPAVLAAAHYQGELVAEITARLGRRRRPAPTTGEAA